MHTIFNYQQNALSLAGLKFSSLLFNTSQKKTWRVATIQATSKARSLQTSSRMHLPSQMRLVDFQLNVAVTEANEPSRDILYMLMIKTLISVPQRRRRL